LAAPIIVKYQDLGVIGWIVVVVLLGAVVWAIAQSKKSAPEL
jgi:hypothetical protein